MIHMLDSRGKKVAEFRSIGDYYVSPISAGVIDEEGTIQIGAIGTYKSESREEFDGWFCGMIFGLDSTGEVVWRTPAWTHHGAWRTPQFGLGDLDGDGRKEWAFMRDFYELVVCNQDGVRIATLDLQRRPDRFAIVSRNENGKEQGLIVLKDEIGVECWGPMSPQYLNEFEESVSEEGLDPNALEPDLVSA
jgi:hypothetical protein